MHRAKTPLFSGLLLLMFFVACTPDNESNIEESFPPELEAYSMPWSAPILSPPPTQFRDNHMITVVFRSEMEVLNKLVPPPLVPNPDGLMFFYIGKLGFESEIIDRFPYLEAGIGVPVTFEASSGNYFIALYLDKALPIVGGREIWGFPKKDAEIVYEEASEKIYARVNRFGTTIAEVSATLGGEVQPIPETAPVPWINFKIIPSIKQGAPPDVMQLTYSVARDAKTLSLQMASEVSLKFSSTTEDPLGEIPVLEVVESKFTVQDMIMDYGKVLHDYLAGKPVP